MFPSENLRPALVQVARHVPRAAAEIAHEAAPPDALGKFIEEGPIERLVGELAVNALGVLLGERVVAIPKRCQPWVHSSGPL
jgi:hypothetical protein